MSRLIDLTSKHFGRLFVIRRVNSDQWGSSFWLCKCNCGSNQETIVSSGHLRNGHTQSCGCLQKEIVTKHGHSTATTSGTYRSWDHMIQRCTNQNYKYYKNYGGRGITVCNRWKKFSNFLEDMGERPKGKSIDRINNNGNYCRLNCKWSTPREQANNRRNNRKEI